MESIQHLIGQLEQNPQWRSQVKFRRIVALWSAVVGPAVSQHSRPTGLHQQVLQVAVSSAAWAQTLTLERLAILQKLRDRLPANDAVTDIRFSTGRWATSPGGTLLPLPQASPLPSPRSTPWPDRPATALAAFNQWAEHLQAQQAQQPQCPQCHRPCPQEELQRWSQCALCATTPWQHTISSQRP